MYIFDSSLRAQSDLGWQDGIEFEAFWGWMAEARPWPPCSRLLSVFLSGIEAENGAVACVALVA